MVDLPSFEKAEYGADPRILSQRCTRCELSLTDRFFLLDGRPLCEQCADAAVVAPAEGADAAFLKAMLNGLAAAIVGCILYAVIELTTGWTIGYVALAVGWLVGKAMKMAAGGRGGRRYQVVAVALTYCAVSCASLVILLYRFRGHEVMLNEHLLGRVVEYILLSPILSLRTGLNGIIGLFILFIGLQAAWSMTAGAEYHITGPHHAAEEAVPLP